MSESTWSQVPALVSSLPDPVLFRRTITERINRAYTDLYEARGTVHVPEDTYDMQRRLAAARDLFSQFRAAFADAEKLLGKLQEEELVEARGEQDGIPVEGLTIPDSEGDIRISLDAPATYEIDLSQLTAVFGDWLADGLDWSAHIDRADLDSTVLKVVDWLLLIGKVEPQVSKVKAWADTLARAGHDQSASIVRGAISKRNPYKGIKFGRKAQ